MTERFTIDNSMWVETGKYRVLDNGKLTTGRFHTYGQAQEWIDAQLLKIARASMPQTGMRGRSRAGLISCSNYSGQNEARISMGFALDPITREPSFMEPSRG